MTPRALTLVAVVALLSGLTSVHMALADRPPGDTCDDPIAVPPDYHWDYTGDLTPLANDYDPSVPGPSCTGSPAPGKDAVFAIQVLCGQFLDVTLEPVAFDGSLYIVTDCADIAGTCVSGADASGLGGAEGAGMTVITGRTFYVIVDAHDADVGGLYHISFGIGLWDIPPGACCFPDGHCELIHIDFCGGEGGVSLGPCAPCEPNPCEPVPVLARTWGAVKARYR